MKIVLRLGHGHEHERVHFIMNVLWLIVYEHSHMYGRPSWLPNVPNRSEAKIMDEKS